MNMHSLRKKHAEDFDKYGEIAKITGARISAIKNLTEYEFKELMKNAKQDKN